MNNNDVLRAIRYALELDAPTLLAMFEGANDGVSAPRLASFLKDDGEPGFAPLSDRMLACFLDGLVAKYRGQREEGAAQASAADGELSNNRILRTFKIAFVLRDGDILGIMQRAGVTLSKSELSALFRRPDHRNYQPCGDQFLRQFLRGLGIWHRQGRPRA
jgi:uncharacterized protein YehS (DUF1456 family)